MRLRKRGLAPLLRHLAVGHPDAPQTTTFTEWWLQQRRRFTGRTRRGFDSFVIGTAWALWKQRNARVFNRAHDQRTPEQVVTQVLLDIKDWSLAGFGVGGLDPFVRE